jgi:hypothetical protein
MSQDKQELLKAVSKILDEALLTYEEIEKSESSEIKKFDHEEVQDPTKVQTESAPVDEPKKDEVETKEESEEEKKKREEAEAAASKDEPKEEDKKDEPKEDEDDEKLMETYKSLCSKMEKRGLIKSDAKVEEVKKSETTEVDTKSELETLKKSVSEQVSDLKSQMEALTKAVEKFAKTPAAPRKGLSGATPLRKSGDGEDKPVLSKEGALNKLLSLKKSGDDRVDTGLINRVETGRLNKNDYERLNSILG